ncbi:(2Fe-2S)-binding protein [Labrys sp. KNU-23]|jgi:bacterioferritin-associated ferredoxin|uniref:(2Fe-2S)-binding protein n=1 Tax=Labrys TaxID=204476 RepID=UPI0011EF2F53|nr:MULTISPECIES: (2Fe-2S)-binding protein [unclassified Labrys (in: a-proteobacteria)]MDZ5450003.1 (2Fe-2S)-binding protein [Labrys sp. ZIDIC5]QEN90200.1 (2Fe-2S)-binding protein [Labrys sp. KNU-23]
MIVCSCRVLTDEDFTSTLATEQPGCPRSAADAYRCLGCGPECGRCLITVRQILADARAAARCHDCTEDCALRDMVEAANTDEILLDAAE